jgi:hypothetical protein
MKTVSYLSFLLVLIMCVAFTNVARGIEVNPTKEQVDETIKIGEANPGKKIFETDLVKPAIFGNWPKYGSGLIKTKLVELAVMAAMKREARKTLSKEDALGMMELNELTISYRGGDDVFRIKLGQGGRLIEPTKMIKPEMGEKGSKEHAAFIMVSFPYSKLDLDAKAMIMVIKDFGEEEYEVDFSRIK